MRVEALRAGVSAAVQAVGGWRAAGEGWAERPEVPRAGVEEAKAAMEQWRVACGQRRMRVARTWALVDAVRLPV